MTGSSPSKKSSKKVLTTKPVDGEDFTGWLNEISSKDGRAKTIKDLRKKASELKAIAECAENLKSKFAKAREEINK